MSPGIHFYSIDVRLNLKSRRLLKKWILEIIQREGSQAGHLSYIFCSDDHLLGMNREWLQHDTLTDVITFDLSSPVTGHSGIYGEVYISLDRIRENARQFKVSTREECCRVMAHGLLHLLGYGDKGKAEKQRMRQKEDLYLSLLRDSGLL
jgi:rRNA maturation RNase YbeY